MSTLFLLSLAIAGALAQTPVFGPDYIALTAAEKQAIIWENTLLDSTSNEWPGIELGEMFFESMCPTMYQGGDELPVAWTGNTRQKYIHSVGTVGKVELVLQDNSYSGLFQGANYGIVRISLANEPSADVLNTAPGLGLKFLRDGVESASLVAMYGVEGQDSWNIFKNTWTNHIPPVPATGALAALGAKFATATPFIQYVGLSDWAQMGESGMAESVVNYPFKLIFKPTGEISFPDEYHGLFTDDLVSIPEGSVLWNVFAMDAPTELGGTEQWIGDLVLRSPLVTSMWGDSHLFFRHQEMGEDLVMHPEWESYLEKFGFGLIPTEC